MSNKNDVDTMTAFSKQVFEAAQHALETLQDGGRMQLKELANVVGLAVAKDPKEVLGFVHHFAHNTTLAYVTRGKNGGLVKGTRPAKVVKPAKKTVVADTTATDTDTADNT